MGLGYCAEGEMVGKKMMGRDNKDWIVGTKNGIKIWQRAPDAPLIREEPVLKKEEIVSDNDDANTDTDSEDEIKVQPQPDDNIIEKVVKEQTPEPMAKVEVQPPAPKKRGRPAKVKEAKPENTDVTKADAKEEAKPKRKYTRKPKNTEDVVEEKKERKPRAKTEYNMYISEKLKELREKHKELKTTEYFKMAIAEWKVYKETKNMVA